jgi:hypothetical protein
LVANDNEGDQPHIRHPVALTDDEVRALKELLKEREFYRRLYRFLGWLSAYAGGVIAAVWAVRDPLVMFFRALGAAFK